MELLLKKMLSEKGRDVNRSLIFVIVLYTAFQITELDRRVAVIEARMPVPRVATVATNAPRFNSAAVARTPLPQPW